MTTQKNPGNGWQAVRGSKQKTQPHNNTACHIFQHVARRWFKNPIVRPACWEMLPAALAVLLLGSQ